MSSLTLHLIIWRLFGLAPFKRKNNKLTTSYLWLAYSLAFHLCLILGLLHVSILKYNAGVSGKYVTKTQLFVRLSEQLFTIIILATCVTTINIKNKDMISIHRRLKLLERQIQYVKKSSCIYVYPLFLLIFYAVFQILRLIFHFTSSTSWDTFIPQWLSSIVICICDFQWLIHVVLLRDILKHFNTMIRFAVSKHSKEYGE